MTEALWALGRATGAVSLLLLSVTVALGIGVRRGRPALGLPRFGLLTVHRVASLTAVALLVVHVGSLLLDPWAGLSLVDIVVPGLAGYRPLWVGLGTAALDLLLAVAVTSLLRHRLGARTWKAVHLLAYAAWPVAVGHVLGAGTDVGTPWMTALLAVCVLGVLAAVVLRLRSAAPERAAIPAPAPTGALR